MSLVYTGVPFLGRGVAGGLSGTIVGIIILNEILFDIFLKRKLIFLLLPNIDLIFFTLLSFGTYLFGRGFCLFVRWSCSNFFLRFFLGHAGICRLGCWDAGICRLGVSY